MTGRANGVHRVGRVFYPPCRAFCPAPGGRLVAWIANRRPVCRVGNPARRVKYPPYPAHVVREWNQAPFHEASSVGRRARLLAALLIALLVGTQVCLGDVLKFDPTRKGLSAVADPAASEMRAVAVDVGSESGKVVLGALKKPLPPGLYRFAPRIRLHLPADYDASRLKLTFSVVTDGKPVAQIPLLWPLFDARPVAYTEFDREVSFTGSAMPSFELSWSVAALAAGEKPRAVRPVKAPSIDDANKAPGKIKTKGSDSPLGDLVSELQADVAVPLASITYPAVLVDHLAFSAESTTLAVEKVWPEKVHVYPGEANPIEVTVRNFQSKPATALVRFEMRTGLDEASAPVEVQLTVPPGSTAKHRFEWSAGKREFGHEARVTILSAGKPVHAASEYFSVSAPIWKTAIQGSGFLAWFGREAQFPEHVESNRRAYINVEEAFSWQPSSWTDLNPTGDDWWTGQGDVHNSMSGLRLWMKLSHANGIKMITYSWPSASGPAGIEWGRKHPDLVTHVGVGLASEFHDVEDLRLHEFVHSNPAFKGHRYGVWHGFGINRGYFEAINLGAEEIIKSARTFGWDGVRFDSPPGWSAMDAAEVHADFERFGVAEKMAKLLPEFFSVKTGNWGDLAISTRNMRWLRHRFETEIGAHFAVSCNFGIETDADGKPVKPVDFLRECSKGGGQLMHEAIRLSSSWESYRKIALHQAEVARQNGGFDTIFVPDRAPAWTHSFAAIFTFASGSHPYLNYGWGPTMAGTYSQFMTRYGEFCWDLALAPVRAAESGITVKSDATLLWQDYVRQRNLADGAVQTVLHLVTPPPTDAVVPAGKNGTMMPWQKDVVVRKKGTVKPVVWLLTAEPRTRAEQLDARAEGDGFAVTVPEHRYWSTLVWTEGAK